MGEKGMEALQHAITEGHRYRAARECEQEVVNAARNFLNVMLNGEPLPITIAAQSRLESAFIRLDALVEPPELEANAAT